MHTSDGKKQNAGPYSNNGFQPEPFTSHRDFVEGDEVIYTGLRRKPSEIVRVVMDEDAVAVGLSTLSGAHNVLIPKVCEELISNNMGDVIVFAGGIIPESDREYLYSLGVRAILVQVQKLVQLLIF